MSAPINPRLPKQIMDSVYSQGPEVEAVIGIYGFKRARKIRHQVYLDCAGNGHKGTQ